MNIGVILGPPSGNLADIDLDCPESDRRRTLTSCRRPAPSSAGPAHDSSHWEYRLQLAHAACHGGVELR